MKNVTLERSKLLYEEQHASLLLEHVWEEPFVIFNTDFFYSTSHHGSESFVDQFINYFAVEKQVYIG